jgi:hypothetical protein
VRVNTIAIAAAVVLSLAAVSGAATDTPAAEEKAPRFRLVVSGVFAPVATEYEEDRDFELFAEQGSLNAAYEAGGAPGVDAGLQFNFSRKIGVLASVALTSRKTDVSIQANLPHPLYLGRPRQVEASQSDLSHKETAAHLALAYTGGSGKVEYTLFAGPSFYQVDAELVNELQALEQYPFDAVTITGVTTSKEKESAVGFHVGGRLDYLVSRSVGLGLLARYGTAKVTLAPTEAGDVEITAGGLEVGLGVRFRF